MASVYFAWCTVIEAHGPQHFVKDERLLTFEITQQEGEAARMVVTLRNPGVGLLSFGPYVWVTDEATEKPIFFGKIDAVPDDILQETVSVVFTAKPDDLDEQKQDLAEELKIPPWYDPIFLDDAHRDDPDSIIRARTALWHMDRVSHVLKISDILIGEDGEMVFTSGVPYNSLKMRRVGVPPKAAKIQGSVTWTQRYTGYIGILVDTMFTYTGDGIMGDWPKTLQQLGGGWSVQLAFIIDDYDLAYALTASCSFDWHNQQREHANGDTLSININVSDPVLQFQLMAYTTRMQQVGVFDPYADPQVNRPAKTQYTSVHVPLWKIIPSMTLKYEAKRERTESVRMRIVPDLQQTDNSESSVEDININGANVGLPIIDVLNWETVSGQSVDVGTVIQIDDPESYQIAIQPGIAGDDEPEFSDIVGVLTADNTVVWASLGPTLFPADVPNWAKNDTTPSGQVILPKAPTDTPYSVLVPYGHETGVSVAEGTVVRPSDGLSYQEATTAGTTGLVEPAFSAPRGSTTNDGSVVWTSLGPTLPGSAAYQLATSSGVTGSLMPAFGITAGVTTLDGTVTWTSLGVDGGFIGMPIVLPERRSYFPTDRGLLSLEHLILLARAPLIFKSRAVLVSWMCKWERALDITLRKNARIVTSRVPGGVAVGKIVSYAIRANITKGLFEGEVTIGCAIGNANTINADAGLDDYVEDDYVAPGYQVTLGQVVLTPSGDIGYEPPVDGVNDDGLVFPLTYDQAVLRNMVLGTGKDGQAILIERAFIIEQEIAQQTGQAGSIQQSIDKQKLLKELNKKGVAAVLKENPQWIEIDLVNVQNGPFAARYDIDTSQLVVTRGINLDAEVSS